MWWRLSIASVFLVVLATSIEASWKWDESSAENSTGSGSSVTSSTSSTSTLSSTTTISQEDETLEPAESKTVTESTKDKDEKAKVKDLLERPANDTDPRFLGGLKRKLCSIGLGINKWGLYECKSTGLKKKLRVSREAKEDKSEPSPRLLGLLGGLTGGSGLDGVKSPAFVPSFGVNFGSLPTGGGYSPYGGNSNPLGLDVGPVSINPFVGFKVASLDGRPVFNPTLDLLVTPNAQGVHALQGIKEGIKHQLAPNKGHNPYGYGYPQRPHSGGYYPQRPHQGGHYPQGGGLPGGGFPVGGFPVGGQFQGNGLYNQYGGYQSSIYSPQSYVQPQPAYRPPYTPPKPVYTPSRPIHTPSRPVYTPSRPVHTPPRPVHSPQVYTPPRPTPIADYSTQHHAPSNPVYTPSRPLHTPSRPLHTPSRPLHTPSRPLHTPSNPIHTPSKPLHIPSNTHHSQKPVEIHHHEHTHFHDHDHDRGHSHINSGSAFNANSFSPIFRSDNKRLTKVSNPIPLSNLPATPRLKSDIPTSSGFVASASTPAKSVFSNRSSDSKKSSTGSSFKFPDP